MIEDDDKQKKGQVEEELEEANTYCPVDKVMVAPDFGGICPKCESDALWHFKIAVTECFRGSCD